MKLSEFIDNLNNFVKENPETLDFDVISSIDDEGNGFNLVVFEPTKGMYRDYDFIDYTMFNESGLDDSYLNSVCIN
jgi:hypothetical protein